MPEAKVESRSAREGCSSVPRAGVLLPCLAALLLLPVGCGSEPVDPDPEADVGVTRSDGGAESDAGTTRDAGLPEDAGEEPDASSMPDPFSVDSTEPLTGETDVPIDSPVLIKFSAWLDLATPTSAFTISDSTGATPHGVWEIQRESARFTPARFRPNETYSVTVSAQVGDGEQLLGEAYSFEFTAGATTTKGNAPPGIQNAPLGPGRLAVTNKRPEYAIVWTTEKSASQMNTYTPGAGAIAIEDPSDDPSIGTSTSRLDVDGLDSPLSSGTEKTPVAGQFDGDGLDEVMIVQLKDGDVSVVVLDATAADTVVPGALSVSIDPPNVAINAVSAVAADFDRDGRDELFVAMMEDEILGQLYWRVIDFDEDLGDYRIAAQSDSTAWWDGASGIAIYNKPGLRVAAGDLDADGLAEPALLFYGQGSGMSNRVILMAFDDLVSGMGLLMAPRKHDILAIDGHCPTPTATLTTADVDSDRAAEIILGTTDHRYVTSSPAGHSCRTHARLYWMENLTAGGTLPPLQGGGAAETNDLGEAWYPNDWPVLDPTLRRPMDLLLAGRFTGDPIRQEVLFYNRIYRFEAQPSVTSNTLMPSFGWPLPVPESIFDHLPAPPTYRLEDLSKDYLTRDAKVGDVDGDGKEDVVLLRKSSLESDADGHPSGLWISYFDLEVASGGGAATFDLHTERLEGGAAYLSTSGSPRLALPNIDGDSQMLELTRHEAVLSDGVLIAVLAPPPWRAGIDQNVDACTTEFAQGTGVSYEHSASGSARLGATVGLSWQPSVTVSALVVGIKLTLAKVEAEVAGGVELGYEHVWGRSFEESLTHDTGAYENLVIVDHYVYDSFLYTVIQAPDPADVGKQVSINVPSARRRSSLSQSYYNAHNGEGPDIDASIIPSVPGDFESYPEREDASALARQGGDGELLIDPSTQANLLEPPVATGSSISWAYDVTSSNTNTGTVSLYAEASLKVCTPDVAGWTPSVCGGFSGGASVGYAYSYSFSESLSFGGTLGSIPEESFSFQNSYRTGPFAYRKTIDPNPGGEPAGPGEPVPGKQQFIVVGWFVE